MSTRYNSNVCVYVDEYNVLMSYNMIKALFFCSTFTFDTSSAFSAMDTLFSILTSSLDFLCPLTSQQAHPALLWLSDSMHAKRTNLRAAERKWWKSKCPEYLLALSITSLQLKPLSSNPKFNLPSPTPKNLFLSFLPSLIPLLPPPFYQVTLLTTLYKR